MRLFNFSPVLAVLALLTLLPTAFGASPTRQQALAAIEVLENRFLSEEAIAASQVITEFVEQSPDVLVMIAPETIPWILDDENVEPGGTEEALRGMLLAAYFAGNTKAQLAAGRADDQPYAGWLAVIRAYRQIQSRIEFRVPSIERFAAMEASGTLERHARAIKASQRDTEGTSEVI